jgi:hypothetical protein
VPAINVGAYTAGYSVVGGARIGQTGQDALLGFFQIGYVLLPILFVIGIWKSYHEKWLFPFFVATVGIATYIFVANPDVNRVMPFVDGVRLLPSFFLPAFFIAGIGMAAVHAAALWLAGRARRHFSWDDLTFAGAAAFSVMIPLAFIFTVVANSTLDQYGDRLVQLHNAAEYSGLEKAYRAIGNERVAFCGSGAVSQHPIYEPGRERTVLLNCGILDELVDSMKNASVRYMLYGNKELVMNGSEKPTITENFNKILNDTRFVEIETGGTVPLFMLRNASGSGVVSTDGASLDYSQVRFDRARFAGSCELDSCEIFFATPTLAVNTPLAAGNYEIEYDKDKVMWRVSGIHLGAFAIDVAPKPPDFAFPLAAACISIVALCYWLSSLPFFGADKRKQGGKL